MSTDTVYSHLAWCNLSRKEGGLGSDLKLPLMSVSPSFFSANYETIILPALIPATAFLAIMASSWRTKVLLYAACSLLTPRAFYGTPLAHIGPGLCADDVLSQITVNDLPVGRSVEETLRLVRAFQFTVSTASSNVTQFSPSSMNAGQTR